MRQGDIELDSVRLHFVGIGGYGMSGLALIMHSLGSEVSGCDLRDSSRVQYLRDRGIPVFLQHSHEHLEKADAVVYSTDVPEDNVEICAAEDAGIQLLHRSEILAHLFGAFRHSIAISGTHGKTSTTAMMAQVLRAAEMSPTVTVGGVLPETGFTAEVGSSEYMVAEACESDGSIIRYHPRHAIATNLEPEHLEFYDNSFDRQVSVFGRFLKNIQPGGIVVLNSQDKRLRKIEIDPSVRKVSCAREPDACADYVAEDVRVESSESRFNLRHRGTDLGQIRLRVLGEHMVFNALQVAALALELGVDLQAIRKGLYSFPGVGRRFQRLGSFAGAQIIDDYAHHPTEVAATLRTAQHLVTNRLRAVFQPQRHTRTQALMEEFSRCFDEADELILTPIYSPPGQNPIPGVSSAVLAQKIRNASDVDVRLMEGKECIVKHLAETSQAGDVVLVMGAGDIWKVAHALAEDDKAKVAATEP